MPREAAESVNQQLGGADFMVPASSGSVEHMALIHALRTVSDGMKRLGEQQDRQSKKIDQVLDVSHSLDKRLTVIESNSVAKVVEDHEERIHKLENSEERRAGAVSAWEWLLKSWPALVGFVALLGALVATGRLTL